MPKNIVVTRKFKGNTKYIGFKLSGAILSNDRVYRYFLWRYWNIDKPIATFIMLNPSTADTHTDDPTIRRLRGFCRYWDMGGFNVVNLFAYRATYPRELNATLLPIGKNNSHYIRASLASTSGPMVAAWGATRIAGKERQIERVLEIVLKDAGKLYCLGTTADGSPRHPVRLSGATPLEVYKSYA